MRTSLLHRLVTAVLILCLGLFSVEAAVADVHDADGSPSAFTSDGPAGRHDGQVPHDELPGESHPMHVCHCTHGHTTGSVAAVDGGPTFGAVFEFAADWALVKEPVTRVQEPLVPPPIV